MYARASKAYKKVHLESASKERILDELYGRFLRDCRDARAAIEKRHVVAKSEAVNHAMSICVNGNRNDMIGYETITTIVRLIVEGR